MPRVFPFVFIVIGLAGCGDDPLPIGDRSVQIVVCDQQSRPVEGAIVQGGVDWDYFQVRTNSDGIAVLPADAEGQRASIYKTNYLPNAVSMLYSGIYPLHQSPRMLRRLGAVAGAVVRFGQDELLTLDYSGTYRVYALSEESIREVVARPLGDSVVLIRSTCLVGDTLWCATNSRGIYAISLRDPLAPRTLFRLNYAGALWPIAVRDSLLIAGNAWHIGPVRILSYRGDGSCTEIGRVSDLYVRRLELIGNAVVVFRGLGTLPVVLDISDPGQPRVSFSGSASGFNNAFFRRPYVILTSDVRTADATHPLRFSVLRVSERGEVTPEGEFNADTWLAGIASGDIAYGRNYFDTNTISFLEGSLASGFTTVATVAGQYYEDIGGAAPPFFIVEGGLWKLGDR